MIPTLPNTADTTQASALLPETPKPHSLTRWPQRIRRSLALLFTGVLIHEALESPTPSPPPAIQRSLEELPPAERRYHERLRATFTDLQRRWPQVIPSSTMERSGKVTVLPTSRNASKPVSINAERNGDTIRLKIDRSGSLVFLCESRGGTRIELWPQQHDLRWTNTLPEKTEFLWTTNRESLFGQRSTDGKLQSLSIEGEGIIDPSLPPALLTPKLTSPHRIFLFQRIFATYQDHTFFATFFRNFRLSLAEWQKRGYAQGSCNTYAETACEVLSKSPHKHYPMHILTYWPSNEKRRFSDPWHQTAAYPTTNGEWCIVDGSMDRLTYVPSPDIYGKEWGLELATTPILGRLPWKVEPRGPFYRFLQHLSLPEEEHSRSNTSSPLPQSMRRAILR